MKRQNNAKRSTIMTHFHHNEMQRDSDNMTVHDLEAQV